MGIILQLAYGNQQQPVGEELVGCEHGGLHVAVGCEHGGLHVAGRFVGWRKKMVGWQYLEGPEI